MSNDLASKPSRGRFFPLPHHAVAARVAELGFSVPSYFKRRLSVRLKNCEVECPLGHQLASFLRLSYVACFSLPESVAPPIAGAALEQALKEFAAIDNGPYLAVRDQQFVVYRAYLGALGLLSIARHIVSAGSRAYLQFEGAAMLSKSQRSPEHQHVVLARQVA